MLRIVSDNALREEQGLSVVEPVVEDFEALFEHYAAYVAAIGLRLLGRDDEVDDLVQEVFFEAYKRQHTIREQGAIKGWLATVTVRMAKRKLKRRRVRRMIGLDQWEGYRSLADPGASPELRLMIARVFARLDDVPADNRIAWTLRHLEDKPLAEIAELCQCSVTTVKRRVARAQRMLEEVWEHD